MLDIKTNELNTRKKVLIDGQEYTVRRLGAGDELAMSQIMRRLTQMQEEVEKTKKFTSEQEEEFQGLQQRSLDIYASTFDDGGDGSKSKELIARLSFQERALLYEKIFAQEDITKKDKPNAPTTEEDDQTEESS